ncbi:MAG: hypothetical protein ACI8RA_000927 [Chlamydiales bacterium]|jgi:hypothetical protein
MEHTAIRNSQDKANCPVISVQSKILGPKQDLSIKEFANFFGVIFLQKYYFQSYSIYKEASYLAYHSPFRKNLPSEKELKIIEWVLYKNHSSWKDDFIIKWINKKIGWGLFANRDIEPGEIVGEYLGEMIEADSSLKSDYTFYYSLSSKKGSAYFIDSESSGNHTRFLNHSSNPNAVACIMYFNNLLHQVFFTIKPVSKGEEVTWDYGPLFWMGREPPAII